MSIKSPLICKENIKTIVWAPMSSLWVSYLFLPDTTPDEPDVSATGIYSGTLTLDSDAEVAMVELVIARNGVTTLSIYADDSGSVSAIAN